MQNNINTSCAREKPSDHSSEAAEKEVYENGFISFTFDAMLGQGKKCFFFHGAVQ